MRRYFEHGERLICVDVHSWQGIKKAAYQQILAREKAEGAKQLTREEWQERIKGKLGRTEWYDLDGRF